MNYKTIDLSSWTQEGEGGIGKTYSRADAPGLLLKVNKTPHKNNEASVRHDVETAQHVLAMGLPTPQVYEVVQVGDCFGMTCERIQGKRSLSRICADEPSRLGEMATLLAAQGKLLHATPCDTTFFPSCKKLIQEAIEAACFIGEDDRQKLRAFAEGLPDETTCVHGDFQTGNLIVSAEGKPYFIDLDWFSYGTPMFDIGHLYLLCNVYSQFQAMRDIFHMTQEQLIALWDAFATAYSGSADHTDFDRRAAMFAPLDICLLSYRDPRPKANPMFARVIHSFVEKYF